MSWLWALTLLMTLAAGAIQAQQPPDFESRLQDWESQLQDARAALAADFANVGADAVESRLESVIQQAQEAADQARERLEAAQAQLETLGKPPAKGGPPEAPEITQLRKDLQQRIAEAQAQVTRANLIISQANELLGSIAAWEQARVRAQLLLRRPPPVTPSVWQAAAVDAAEFAARVLRSPIAWWQARQQEEAPAVRLLWLLLLPLAGLLIGWPIRRSILTRFGRDPSEPDPTYARRLVAAFADGVANAIIPVAIIVLVAAALAWKGVLAGLFAYLIYWAVAAIAAFLIVYGLSRAALSPHLVQWRIVPVEPAYTGKLLRAVGTVVALLAVSLALLATVWKAEQLTAELESVFFLIQATVTAAALAWLLTPKYWAPSIVASQRLGTAEEHAEALGEEEGTDEPEGARRPRWIRIVRVLRVLVLLTPFAALAGYGRLAFYFQSRLVATGALVGLALLLRLALREVLERVLTGRHRKRHQRVRGAAADTADSGVKLTVYWAGLGIDILLLIPLIYLLLLVYGVPLTTLGLWTDRLLSGITIGSVTISFADVLWALAVLVLGVFATNLVRRWLATRLLPNTRLDIGARNSIAAGISYTGVGLAILLAVAALGIDFSSLALIAGALSVGIGFGLQNVVQNFAAGILLLIERPIKVGDWIKVGTTEGVVKKISVRSTEIETFDRNSVFVPNSDLISSPVTNWTHENRIARIILPVRAAYGSDPRKVEEILLRCAREEPQVLRFPEAYVWFLGFGESALEFELRAYIGDTDDWVTADSGLYYAIEAAFREAGIVIPFPQRDLHIRSGLGPYGGPGAVHGPVSAQDATPEPQNPALQPGGATLRPGAAPGGAASGQPGTSSPRREDSDPRKRDSGPPIDSSD